MYRVHNRRTHVLFTDTAISKQYQVFLSLPLILEKEEEEKVNPCAHDSQTSNSLLFAIVDRQILIETNKRY